MHRSSVGPIRLTRTSAGLQYNCGVISCHLRPHEETNDMWIKRLLDTWSGGGGDLKHRTKPFKHHASQGSKEIKTNDRYIIFQRKPLFRSKPTSSAQRQEQFCCTYRKPRVTRSSIRWPICHSGQTLCCTYEHFFSLSLYTFIFFILIFCPKYYYIMLHWRKIGKETERPLGHLLRYIACSCDSTIIRIQTTT